MPSTQVRVFKCAHINGWTSAFSVGDIIDVHYAQVWIDTGFGFGVLGGYEEKVIVDSKICPLLVHLILTKDPTLTPGALIHPMASALRTILMLLFCLKIKLKCGGKGCI